MPDLTPDVERELAAIDDALAGRRVAADLTELGELALALREQRPEPGPAFGSALDAKVERGFRDPGPRRRTSGRSWFSWTAPALGALATVMLVAVVVVSGPSDSNDAGTSGGSASSGGQSSAPAADAGATAASAGSEGGGGAAAADADARELAPQQDESAGIAEPLPSMSVPPAPGQGSPGSDGRDRRSVERSASLTLSARSRDIDTVSARIQDVTRQQGGFVVASTVNSSEGGGGGTFQLRVPTRNLDAAMAALARLGKVRERAQSAQDITAQAVSARSRLKDARTERKSLLRQLGDAVTLAETDSIRARLRLVSREIERARADVRRVNNRAAFSTVVVTLVSDNSAAPGPADDEWTPGDAAEDALRVLEVAAGIALIVLAVAIPLALLAAMAAVATRWTRRRRREQALDAV